MIPLLGQSLVVLTLALSVAGAIISFLAGRAVPELLPWARWSVFTVSILLAVITGTMLYALVAHDFSVRYVVQVGSRETPLYYTVTSLWGALEGSILYWAFLLGCYSAFLLLVLRDRFRELQGYMAGILLAILSFFLFVLAGPGNPFQRVSPVPADGQGPNVLLQNHWMMGVHPQLLYLGYVGLSVPYAIAIASLLRGHTSNEVLRLVRRWTLLPWALLTAGIVAGMWWSYAVLGWGGYWAWDPVENASLMPWLVATAFLHSLQVQERRQMLKAWTLCLIIAAFILSILGTFLTRSGVIVSVHSFTQSSIGPVFLIFLSVVLVGSLTLLLHRLAGLRATGFLQSTVSRETAFLLNNVLLVAATMTVLLGTLFPLIGEALQGTQLSVGAPYFNRVNIPVGIALLFLMGVGPALPWGITRMQQLQWTLLPPVAIGVAVIGLLLLSGLRGTLTLITFGLCAFVATVTLQRIVNDARARARNTREAAISAVVSLVRANPRRYGGFLAHLGVLVAVMGIAASQSYQVRSIATLKPGASVRVDGYTLRFLGLSPKPQPNRMVMGARFVVSRNGLRLYPLTPSLNFYPGRTQPVVTPAVREEPLGIIEDVLALRNPLPDLSPLGHGQNSFEDLYVVLQGIDAKRGSVTAQVIVNPLVGFIWMGGAMAVVGALLALRQGVRHRVEVPHPLPRALRTEEATA